MLAVMAVIRQHSNRQHFLAVRLVVFASKIFLQCYLELLSSVCQQIDTSSVHIGYS